MQLGQKIKELRMMYGLTQEELADRAELSKGFISQLENNLTSPSISTLEDILQCLGMSISEFFALDKQPVQIVFGNIHIGEQRIFLENRIYLSFVWSKIGYIFSLKHHSACIRCLKASQYP